MGDIIGPLPIAEYANQQQGGGLTPAKGSTFRRIAARNMEIASDLAPGSGFALFESGVGSNPPVDGTYYYTADLGLFQIPRVGNMNAAWSPIDDVTRSQSAGFWVRVLVDNETGGSLATTLTVNIDNRIGLNFAPTIATGKNWASGFVDGRQAQLVDRSQIQVKLSFSAGGDIHDQVSILCVHIGATNDAPDTLPGYADLVAYNDSPWPGLSQRPFANNRAMSAAMIRGIDRIQSFVQQQHLRAYGNHWSGSAGVSKGDTSDPIRYRFARGAHGDRIKLRATLGININVTGGPGTVVVKVVDTSGSDVSGTSTTLTISSGGDSFQTADIDAHTLAANTEYELQIILTSPSDGSIALTSITLQEFQSQTSPLVDRRTLMCGITPATDDPGSETDGVQWRSDPLPQKFLPPQASAFQVGQRIIMSLWNAPVRWQSNWSDMRSLWANAIYSAAWRGQLLILDCPGAWEGKTTSTGTARYSPLDGDLLASFQYTPLHDSSAIRVWVKYHVEGLPALAVGACFGVQLNSDPRRYLIDLGNTDSVTDRLNSDSKWRVGPNDVQLTNNNGAPVTISVYGGFYVCTDSVHGPATTDVTLYLDGLVIQEIWNPPPPDAVYFYDLNQPGSGVSIPALGGGSPVSFFHPGGGFNGASLTLTVPDDSNFLIQHVRLWMKATYSGSPTFKFLLMQVAGPDVEIWEFTPPSAPSSGTMTSYSDDIRGDLQVIGGGFAGVASGSGSTHSGQSLIGGTSASGTWYLLAYNTGTGTATLDAFGLELT